MRQQAFLGNRPKRHPFSECSIGDLGRQLSEQTTSTPSRRCPGTVPTGLTNCPQSIANRNTPPTFFCRYRRSYLSTRRRESRRLWRSFKRTVLWGRAQQAARSHYATGVAKRKCLTKRKKHKIQLRCKRWFQKTILDRKAEFYNKRSSQIKQRVGKPFALDRKTAKSNALKVNRTIRAACLNVRGLNKITKRELIMDIMRKKLRGDTA